MAHTVTVPTGSVRAIDPDDPVERAAALADDLLFPSAPDVDGAARVPQRHLDRLASGGFYGLAGPSSYGGMELDFERACAVVERIAGGCLSTAFVWLQHHSTVLSLTFGDHPQLRERLLGPMCRGELRTGIAFNGVRPGGGTVRATASGDGYVLDGETDWVTGWGMVDLLQVAALDDRGDTVFALVDAEDGPALGATGRPLLAGGATGTVRLSFRGVPVPADRVLGVHPPAGPDAVDARSVRINTALGVGVAARCVRLLGDPPGLAAELARCRGALADADDAGVADGCAATHELAVRAATALFVASGSRSVLQGHHAGRLVREAMLLTVFGSRPSIRNALLDRLGAAGAAVAATITRP